MTQPRDRDLPTRADLAHADLIHQDGRRKPRVFRLSLGGHTYAIKDASLVPALGRRIWRWWLRREARAYAALAGIDGIPVCYGLLDREALILSYLDGGFLCREATARLAPGYFEQLERLVAAMHARGWFHLDLGHRRNVLVLADGRPGVVDFAAALPWARVPVLGWIGCWIDRRCVRRLAQRYGPQQPMATSAPVAN